MLYVDDFTLSELTPNGYTATWYDDDTIWHYRMLLAPARPGRYAVVTHGLQC